MALADSGVYPVMDVRKPSLDGGYVTVRIAFANGQLLYREVVT
jgi:hypothetical protein